MSKLIETRLEFQELAEVRLAEAKVLLDNGKWDGAYYLAGYAVELALKACIIKLVMATDAFLEKDFSRNCYTHDAEKLMALAGLDSDFNAAMKADPTLFSNWILVKAWSETKRYHRIDQFEAEKLFAAISDDTHGVLTWVKAWW